MTMQDHQNSVQVKERIAIAIMALSWLVVIAQIIIAVANAPTMHPVHTMGAEELRAGNNAGSEQH